MTSNASSSSHRSALAAALAFALVPGCGFITVNGKPLVASTSSSNTGNAGDSTGSTSSSTGSASNASSTSGQPAAPESSGATSAPASRPVSTKRIEDVAAPDPKAALASWTPAQQWMPRGKWGSNYG